MLAGLHTALLCHPGLSVMLVLCRAWPSSICVLSPVVPFHSRAVLLVMTVGACLSRPIVVCSTTTAGLLLPQPNSSRPSAAVAIRAPGAPAPATACNTNWWQQQMQSLLGSSGLFDLVVVDESGQGLAPEVLLPLSLARPKVSAAHTVLQLLLHLAHAAVGRWLLSCIVATCWHGSRSKPERACADSHCRRIQAVLHSAVSPADACRWLTMRVCRNLAAYT